MTRTDYYSVGRDDLYLSAVADFGQALDRLATGYEADPEKRRDLRQDIHLQIWKSLERFDGRCSLKTWIFRVAHNTCVSWVTQERRNRARWVTLEEMHEVPLIVDPEHAIDHSRAVQHLADLIRTLKPLDRQIMLSYLEDMDTASIAEITGLSQANICTKLYRIRSLLARSFAQEEHHG